MPRLTKPKKDVVGSENPREDLKQSMIRGCPNGETHLSFMASAVHLCTAESWGIETS